MKKTLILILAAVSATALLSACKSETPAPASAPQGMAQSATPGIQPGAETANISGVVVETMNTAGYTYVQVDTGEGLIWAAGPETQVKVGDTVALAPGQEMHNLQSKTLNRTFDVVLFVPAIMVGGETAAQNGASGMGGMMSAMQMPPSHPEMGTSQPVEIDFTGLVPAEGGQTIADIYAQKDSLSGQDILVRGKVVRFSPQIMGKNWLHLQDGTATDGKGDITVTTTAMAQVGDTVLVKGVLGTDKDIAHGNVYEVIIEDAEVTVE